MEFHEALARCPEDACFVFKGFTWTEVKALRLILLGSPFWKDPQKNSENDPPPEEFTLLCTGVEELSVQLRSGTLITGLSLSDNDPLLWDYGPTSTIFGTAPLPDPPRFFYELYRLALTLHLRRDPAKYLNWQESLKEWEQYVYSRAYRLLTAPAPFVEAITFLLDVQAAEYTVLADEDPQPPAGTLRVLSLGTSWIMARTVSLEPRP